MALSLLDSEKQHKQADFSTEFMLITNSINLGRVTP